MPLSATKCRSHPETATPMAPPAQPEAGHIQKRLHWRATPAELHTGAQPESSHTKKHRMRRTPKVRTDIPAGNYCPTQQEGGSGITLAGATLPISNSSFPPLAALATLRGTLRINHSTPAARHRCRFHHRLCRCILCSLPQSSIISKALRVRLTAMAPRCDLTNSRPVCNSGLQLQYTSIRTHNTAYRMHHIPMFPKKYAHCSKYTKTNIQPQFTNKNEHILSCFTQFRDCAHPIP